MKKAAQIQGLHFRFKGSEIGQRERELVEAAALLEMARLVSERYPGGVQWTDLAPLTDGDL